MSVELAQAFIEKMKADEDFLKKVLGCKDAEARMAVAKAAGFEFTAEEARACQEELTEEQLALVSGSSCYIPCTVMLSEVPT